MNKPHEDSASKGADFYRKANRCVGIAKRQHPKAPGRVVEDAAYKLMSKTDDELTLLEKVLDEQGVEPAEELFAKEVFPQPVIRFEDLSQAAVKGLDAYRAFMRKGDVEVFREGSLFIRAANSNVHTCTALAGVVLGFMLSAGATFEEALKGNSFASRHNWWIKQTARKAPGQSYPIGEDDEDDSVFKAYAVEETVYDCTFVG